MFTENEVAKVLREFPTLNTFGFDTSGAVEERRAALAEATDQINEVAQWLLCNVRLSRGINHQRSAYGLKHLCGNDIGHYVFQGVFIVAAILIGCKYQICGQWVRFNISESSISSIERRLIHDKSRCQHGRQALTTGEAPIRMAA